MKKSKLWNLLIWSSTSKDENSTFSLFFFTSIYISIKLSVWSKRGFWRLLIETQRNMKHLVLIKNIEKQQKIRSVLIEFISHKPHIWYIYYDSSEFMVQLLMTKFLHTYLIFHISNFCSGYTNQNKRFIYSFILKWYITFILVNDIEKYKIQCISDQML